MWLYTVNFLHGIFIRSNSLCPNMLLTIFLIYSDVSKRRKLSLMVFIVCIIRWYRIILRICLVICSKCYSRMEASDWSILSWIYRPTTRIIRGSMWDEFLSWYFESNSRFTISTVKLFSHSVNSFSSLKLKRWQNEKKNLIIRRRDELDYRSLNTKWLNVIQQSRMRKRSRNVVDSQVNEYSVYLLVLC